MISGLRERLLARGGRREHGLPHRHRQGHLVLPGIQTVGGSRSTCAGPLSIECVTHQGIPLGIQGVVIFKVGDDYVSIANAAAASSTSSSRWTPGCTTCSPATCGRSSAT